MPNQYVEEFSSSMDVDEFTKWMESNLKMFKENTAPKYKFELKYWINQFLSWSEYLENQYELE